MLLFYPLILDNGDKIMKKEKANNTSKVNKKVTKIVIVASCVVGAAVCGVLGFVIGNNVRTSKINKQAMNYINLEEKTSTIFCSGKNIALSNEAYTMIKDEGLDLVVCTGKYYETIANENVEQKFDTNIEVVQNGNYEHAFDVNINDEGVKALKVKLNSDKEYFSEFVGEEFVSNNQAVVDGMITVKMVDDTKVYTLAYIVPSEIILEDMNVNKGASKDVKLGLDKKDYTFGSIKLVSDTETGIEIDGFKITGKEVGEYTLTAVMPNGNKEAKVKVEPSVESIELDKFTLELFVNDSTTINASFTPEDAVNKDLEWASNNEGIAKVDEAGKITGVAEGTCEVTCTTKDEPKVSATVQVEVKARPYVSQVYNAPQVTGITYVNGIMLVNKTHPVPRDYAPGLQPVAYNAFLQLRADAAKAGYDIQLLSGYRSYDLQSQLYTNYCNTYGQAAADTFSARPGTSEHQTGLAMDVGWIDDAYGDTPSGQWLAANCYKYGFILRYMKGKESITGYKYEPWHIRYVGDVAGDIYRSGLCLEEYLGVLN